MGFETIQLTKENHDATLTLNRPDKRNALKMGDSIWKRK
jgi:enoyl-CoA hydratase/carnithine racemase